jgi:hypothetical protein
MAANEALKAPWPQLAAMAQDLKDGILTRIVKAGMRAGLTRWRDEYIPLRFSHSARSVYGFANRSVSYAKRRLKGSKGVFKGNLPDFVFTGRFRDALLKRKPRAVRDSNAFVTYKFSIFGSVMNAIGDQRGYLNEVESRERITETVKAHTRNGRTVRSHQRTGYRKTWKISMSPRTYAQEWALTPTERAAAVSLVNEETRRILESAKYMDPKTGRFKARFLREELINS